MQFKRWLLNEHKVCLRKTLIGQYGHIKVFSVNGECARDSSVENEEFGEYGVHNDFPNLIPKNEIWIEDDISEEELPAIVTAALMLQKNLDRGMNPQKAYDLAERRGEKYRHAKVSSKKNPLGTNEPAPKNIYVKKYGELRDQNITVWLVDAEKVRDRWKHDYLEGGNPTVYPWVPNNEIWLESGLHPSELPYILLHEFTEMMLMKHQHINYDKAHDIAAKIEFSKRKPGFSKANALSLTKEQALQMAKVAVK